MTLKDQLLNHFASETATKTEVDKLQQQESTKQITLITNLEKDLQELQTETGYLYNRLVWIIEYLERKDKTAAQQEIKKTKKEFLFKKGSAERENTTVVNGTLAKLLSLLEEMAKFDESGPTIEEVD